jgi:hypothetical protein
MGFIETPQKVWWRKAIFQVRPWVVMDSYE